MIFWVIRRKKLFYYYRSDPDPFFHETDPRIRISIKMKRIRNTGSWDCIPSNIPAPLERDCMAECVKERV